MNYAILRVQKLKTNTAVRGSLKHAFREQNTPNADPSRESENTHLGASSVAEGMTAFKDRLPDKIRKNGVRCIEYLMTASPEKMNDMSRDEQDAFFSDSLDWLKKKHGSENVVYSGIHRDEKTPHMYAYVVPIDEKGKLNCRRFLGGTKHVLSELQDDFAKRVGKEHGMDRGVKGSKAKHQTVQEYYTKLNEGKAVKHEVMKPKTLNEQSGKGMLGKAKAKLNNVMYKRSETKEEVIERLAEHTATLSVKAQEDQWQAERSTKTIQSLDAQLKELDQVRNLDRKDQEEILKKAKEMKAKKDLELKLKREAKAKNRHQNRER